MMCYVPEAAATVLAYLAAGIHFAHSVGLEEKLCRYGITISPARLHRLTKIAYPALMLKLANEVSAGMGLNFWATILGGVPKQVATCAYTWELA